jgi:hypothetical protein
MKKPNNIIKPNEAPLHILQRVTAKYGRINYRWDFFSADLKTYFKLTAIDLSRNFHAHDVLKL